MWLVAAAPVIMLLDINGEARSKIINDLLCGVLAELI